MEPNTRLDLEAAFSRWRAASALDAETLAELEAHLRDACADGVARGLDSDDAFHAALAQLGDVAQLSAEFSKLQQHRTSSTMNIQSLVQSPRLRHLARQLIIAIAIVLPLRVFAIAPYRVPNASVAPEIPAGSHLIVWRIAPTFAPGDIAAYHNGSKTFLGRVTAVSATDLTLTRANTPAFSVPRAEIVGRVILATR